MKRLLLFVLAAFAFAACTQNEVEEQVAVRHDVPDSITVGFEGDDTRIQLNEAQKTVWTKGDHVSVFYRSAVNEDWRFMGETGDRTGNITPVDNSVNPPATHNRVVVVYPYNADYFFNTETYNVEASLPAVQSYLKDSYGTNGNVMISSSEFNQVSLKSVCGWLKLQLTGDGEVVKSITLRGNSGEQVAGLIYIDSANAAATLASASGDAGENEVGGTLVRPGTILTEVTLDCGEGVALGKDATAFYIALPPQTFEKGLMVDVNCWGYYPMSISTQNVVTIERNHIQPMSEVEFSSEVRTIANNEIWYTAKEKIEDAQWTYDTFGANIVSHEWDSTTGKGIISFDDDIAIIGDNAFYENENLTSVTFNNSLKNIGRSAFQGCSSLTEVTIPGNIEEVGYWSFADCLNLTQINIEKGDGQLSAFYAFDNVAANLYVDRDLEGGFLNYAFSDTKLTSITIGPNMKHIEECVFGYCEELQSLNFDQNSQVETIGRYAFVASNIPCVVHIPESVVEIDPSAFASTTGIKAFTSDSPYYGKGYNGELRCDSTLFRYPSTEHYYPIISSNQYNKIGDYAFSGSDITLVYLLLYDDVSLEIGDLAFWKCNDLSVFEPYHSGFKMQISSIGDGVFGYTAIEALNFLDSTFTSINGTFRQCEALQSLYLPASLTEIGERSFEDCKNLTSLYIAATTPPTLSSDAFNVVADKLKIYVPFESLNAYRTNWSEYSDRFVAYDFENGVVVDIPNNEIWYTATDKVTPNNSDAFNATIQSNEWNSTTGIGVITFDGEVTAIDNDAFYYCDNLTSVTIPKSVSKIGYTAFYRCDNLKSVYCTSITPPTAALDYYEEWYAFDSNASDIKIYVPYESVDAYRSADGWNEYADAIVGYNF